VLADFEYDISVNYQYGTLEQPMMKHIDDDFDDDPLLDTLPLALRRPRRTMHPRVWYTPCTFLFIHLLVISYGFYLSFKCYELWTFILWIFVL
jgi:hypothetical protein